MKTVSLLGFKISPYSLPTSHWTPEPHWTSIIPTCLFHSCAVGHFQIPCSPQGHVVLEFTCSNPSNLQNPPPYFPFRIKRSVIVSPQYLWSVYGPNLFCLSQLKYEFLRLLFFLRSTTNSSFLFKVPSILQDLQCFRIVAAGCMVTDVPITKISLEANPTTQSPLQKLNRKPG